MTIPLHDLTRSARSFVRNPALAAALLLTVALGTGGPLAIRGFIQGLPDSNPAQRVAFLLTLAAGALFAIAGANVAVLLLGRAAARSKESSLKVALGAGRAAMARQMLADSLVITVAGSAAGLVVTSWLVRALPVFLLEDDAARMSFHAAPGQALAAAGVCALVTLACGLLPIWLTARHEPAAVLRRESAGASTHRRRLRTALAVLQMALCFLLVLAAAHLSASLDAAMKTAAGRKLGAAVIVTAQASPAAGLQYFEQLEAAARQTGAFGAGAWTDRPPAGLPTWRRFRVEPAGLPLRTIQLDQRAAGRAGLPLSAGRMFGYEDRVCPAAVVNRAAAAALAGPESLGKILELPGGQLAPIIGIADLAGRPAVYLENAPARGIAKFRTTAPAPVRFAELDAHVASPEFYDLTGFTLVDGRAARAGGCREAVVNQQAAERFFGGAAVGAALIDDTGRRTTVTGIIRGFGLGSFQREEAPGVYFPMRQDVQPVMTLLLTAHRVDGPLVDALQRRVEVVRGRGPAPVVVRSLDAYLRQTALAPQRIAMVILDGTAALALALCVLGLYGVLNDAAREQRRPLAIRIALGARRRHVVAHVLKDGMRVTAAAIAVALPASWLVMRLLGEVAPGGAAPALWVWLAAPAALGVGVVAASLGPVRRSMCLDPIAILRQE